MSQSKEEKFNKLAKNLVLEFSKLEKPEFAGNYNVVVEQTPTGETYRLVIIKTGESKQSGGKAAGLSPRSGSRMPIPCPRCRGSGVVPVE